MKLYKARLYDEQVHECVITTFSIVLFLIIDKFVSTTALYRRHSIAGTRARCKNNLIHLASNKRHWFALIFFVVLTLLLEKMYQLVDVIVKFALIYLLVNISN